MYIGPDIHMYIYTHKHIDIFTCVHIHIDIITCVDIEIDYLIICTHIYIYTSWFRRQHTRPGYVALRMWVHIIPPLPL